MSGDKKKLAPLDGNRTFTKRQSLVEHRRLVKLIQEKNDWIAEQESKAKKMSEMKTQKQTLKSKESDRREAEREESQRLADVNLEKSIRIVNGERSNNGDVSSRKTSSKPSSSNVSREISPIRSRSRRRNESEDDDDFTDSAAYHASRSQVLNVNGSDLNETESVLSGGGDLAGFAPPRKRPKVAGPNASFLPSSKRTGSQAATGEGGISGLVGEVRQMRETLKSSTVTTMALRLESDRRHEVRSTTNALVTADHTACTHWPMSSLLQTVLKKFRDQYVRLVQMGGELKQLKKALFKHDIDSHLTLMDCQDQILRYFPLDVLSCDSDYLFTCPSVCKALADRIFQTVGQNKMADPTLSLLVGATMKTCFGGVLRAHLTLPYAAPKR